MTIRWWSRRRLVGSTIGFAVVVTLGLVAGFQLSPAAKTDELPRSITVGSIKYERAHLVTFKTYPGKKRVSVSVPSTSRPIMVRAACRLSILHTTNAMSALMVETRWMRTGGNAADLPDTEGNEYLWCDPGGGNDRLEQTIDASWLPSEGDQRQLVWHELPTIADTSSDAPASWALAIYTDGQHD